jgi:DNA-binding protein H-NS
MNRVMMNSDLKAMSVDELWTFHETVTEVLTAKMLAEKKTLEGRLQQLQQVGSAQHATVQSGRRPYPEVLPKFRNPEVPSETWSGRGKRPRWLSKLLASGKTLDDFLITARAA